MSSNVMGRFAGAACAKQKGVKSNAIDRERASLEIRI
jgi:hypothetical protein